jgi:hypothetical protein
LGSCLTYEYPINTNTFKNHNLIFFCHGIFSTIEKEKIQKLTISKEKGPKVFFKRERRTWFGDL